ncbi:Arfaptin (AH) domain/BAR domain [Trinorchestia longiramus]|nr:Arfaptin (AH) domain/BAR domain [Trinorchestia longiramus]
MGNFINFSCELVQALLKLATSYQNRKIACVPDIRLEDGSEAWNVYSVWRTVLDETEKLGKCRLAGVEVFQQHISEDAKQTRLNKINLGKKLSDQLVTCQKELQLQVQELDRLKKIYTDEESVAMDAREKATAAEDKLKRKKGSIFQSITSLQKNSAKQLQPPSHVQAGMLPLACGRVSEIIRPGPLCSDFIITYSYRIEVALQSQLFSAIPLSNSPENETVGRNGTSSTKRNTFFCCSVWTFSNVSLSS